MARITASEIVNITFEHAAFRGYNPEQVDAVLDDAKETIDALTKENASLTEKVNVLTSQIEEFRQRESALNDLLIKGQKANDDMLRDTRARCTAILNDAQEKRREIISSAEAIGNAKIAAYERSIAAETTRYQEAGTRARTFIDRLVADMSSELEAICSLRDRLPAEFASKEPEEKESGAGKFFDISRPAPSAPVIPAEPEPELEPEPSVPSEIAVEPASVSPADVFSPKSEEPAPIHSPETAKEDPAIPVDEEKKEEAAMAPIAAPDPTEVTEETSPEVAPAEIPSQPATVSLPEMPEKEISSPAVDTQPVSQPEPAPVPAPTVEEPLASAELPAKNKSSQGKGKHSAKEKKKTPREPMQESSIPRGLSWDEIIGLDTSATQKKATSEKTGVQFHKQVEINIE